jgi:hypothetical protein
MPSGCARILTSSISITTFRAGSAVPTGGLDFRGCPRVTETVQARRTRLPGATAILLTIDAMRPTANERDFDPQGRADRIESGRH